MQWRFDRPRRHLKRDPSPACPSDVEKYSQADQVAAIVRAVMGLGRGLGLPVLAEGVEILGELKFLDAEACEIGQGYYLGRPSPLETFGELTGVTAPVIQDEDARHRSGSILMLEPAAALRST